MTDKLLELLNDNARYTNAELAAMLGISEQQVEAQIRELEMRGVICGYKPLVNWEKTDTNLITALIEIRVTPQPDEGFETIAERIMGFDEVESIYLMSGGFDFAVMVRGKTFQQVAMFVAKRLSPLEHVLSTATHFVLHRYKDMGVTLVGEKDDDRGIFSF